MMRKLPVKEIFALSAITMFFFLLMISFSFPDLFAMFYVPHMLQEGNIYSLVALKKGVCPWLSATWPPLYYLTIGTYLYILELLQLLDKSLFTTNACPVFELILNKSFLFLAKLPFLLLHFASAWVFSLFFGTKRLQWFLLWLLNPVSVFVNFIQGQFEIMATFPLLAAFYFAKKDKFFLCALLLGIGGAYKHFPFLLSPLFAITVTHSLSKRVLFLIITAIPYLLSLIPVFNQDFLQSLQFSENYKMLDVGFSFGGFKVSVYILLYLLLIFMFLKETQKTFTTLTKYSFLLSAIYFLVTPLWFLQRLLFLMPSLLLLSSRRKYMFRSLPLLYGAYFLYTLLAFPGLFDHTLLRPLIPSVIPLSMHSLTTISEDFLKMFAQLFMVLFFSWLSYLAVRRREHQIEDPTSGIHGAIAALCFYLISLSILLVLSSRIVSTSL